jgi:hypothetical protein
MMSFGGAGEQASQAKMTTTGGKGNCTGVPPDQTKKVNKAK